VHENVNLEKLITGSAVFFLQTHKLYTFYFIFSLSNWGNEIWNTYWV